MEDPKLQVEIEILTMLYEESSILKPLPDFVELMIRPPDTFLKKCVI